MASTGPTGPNNPIGTTPQTGASYINPPRSLDVLMHYFISGSGDDSIPPSLEEVLNSLQPNEYLVRGNVVEPQFISAYVYNPGTQYDEQYYDAYNVIPGDWLANDGTGFTWKITEIYNVTDAP
jgi:hypothetical protein